MKRWRSIMVRPQHWSTHDADDEQTDDLIDAVLDYVTGDGDDD